MLVGTDRMWWALENEDMEAVSWLVCARKAQFYEAIDFVSRQGTFHHVSKDITDLILAFSWDLSQEKCNPDYFAYACMVREHGLYSEITDDHQHQPGEVYIYGGQD